MTKILTFDVGKKGGVAFKDAIGEVSFPFDFTSLQNYYERVVAYIELYKPDIVGAAYPTRFYRVIVFQSKLLAIVELACEAKGVQFFEVQDGQAKKAILGNGHAKKEEIMKVMRVDSEHQADALMFAKHLFNLCKDGESSTN